MRDYPSDWEDATGPDDSSTSELSVHLNVGAVKTTANHGHLESEGEGSVSRGRSAQTGKIVSFPNWLQVKTLGSIAVTIGV
jgi:hypothetical protein